MLYVRKMFMYSTHCFGQKMNSIGMFQSCNEFQKHCRGRSILTPEDPQKKKTVGKCSRNSKTCDFLQKLSMLGTSIYFV